MRYRQGAGRFNGHHFASNTPLTLAEAIEKVPAIGAHGPRPSVSARYGHVDTTKVVNALLGAGYLCVGAHQTRSRKPEFKPFAKHIVQFTRPDLRNRKFGDDTGDIRIVISNSHDGSGAYIGSLGLFKHACTNSLVVSLGLGCFRVRHHLNAPGEVLEATYRVLDNIPLLEDRVKQFIATPLTQEKQRDFAAKASYLRWSLEERPIQPEELLTVTRYADAPSTLWHTLNRVQEHLICGGIPYQKANHEGVIRNYSTRPIHAPTEVVKVNRRLWELAEEFAGV